jgi:hypothetical protein
MLTEKFAALWMIGALLIVCAAVALDEWRADRQERSKWSEP